MMHTRWIHILGMAILMAFVSTWPARSQGGGRAPKPTCGGAVREVGDIAALRKAVSDVTFGILRPGSVIRLLDNTYRLDEGGRSLSINNVKGTSEKCPITLEGAGGGAVIDGMRQPETDFFRRNIAPSTGLDRIEQAEKSGAVAGSQSRRTSPGDFINCLRVEKTSWVVISNLAIRNCWPSALYINDASYVTLRNTTIVGATYAVAAYGDTDHILVEGNDWTQDPSGDLWARIPWAALHHGSKRYFNGALFGSKDIGGGVVFRNNTIRDAFNGIRMKGTACGANSDCRRNLNVEIYDNSFQNVRDNPVEPEGYAANWWIHHNQINNAHAWFSFDSVYGGPHYVFGNTGWFDNVPTRECRQISWDFQEDALNGFAPDEKCTTHRVGTVLKLDNNLALPLYVFHNSWHLRVPVASGGRSGPLRHWNNAIEFCKPLRGDQVCRAVPFFAADAKRKFLWINVSHYNYWFDDYDFRHDLSNHPGFPRELQGAGFQVNGEHAADLGFRNGAAGDFTLRSDSPARGKGCVVTWSRDNSLACIVAAGASAPDIGAYQGDKRFKGPAFRHVDGRAKSDDPYVERPRIVDVDWGRSTDGQLALTFSVPIAYGAPVVPVELEFKDDSASVTANCLIGGSSSTSLNCKFPVSSLDTASVNVILLPRQIVRRDGENASVTLWASTDPRVKLAE